MGSSKKERVFLLICMCVCMALMSCKPRGTEEGPKESKSDSVAGQVDVRREGLSQEEIIDAANRALRQMELDPKKCAVLYDEGNRFWKDAFPKLLPDLKGHDYQAIEYWERHYVPTPSEPVWIVIDRKTGDVLKTIVGTRVVMAVGDSEPRGGVPCLRRVDRRSRTGYRFTG